MRSSPARNGRNERVAAQLTNDPKPTMMNSREKGMAGVLAGVAVPVGVADGEIAAHTATALSYSTWAAAWLASQAAWVRLWPCVTAYKKAPANMSPAPLVSTAVTFAAGTAV